MLREKDVRERNCQLIFIIIFRNFRSRSNNLEDVTQTDKPTERERKRRTNERTNRRRKEKRAESIFHSVVENFRALSARSVNKDSFSGLYRLGKSAHRNSLVFPLRATGAINLGGRGKRDVINLNGRDEEPVVNKRISSASTTRR